MAYETVILNKEDGIAVLTLNRPDKLNAVNMQMREEILGILAELEADPEIRVLIVTGAGRGFSAGADINEFAAASEDPELQRTVNQSLLAMAKAFYEFEKPVIGAINGVAAGDGAQWTLAFDLNIASEKAKFGWPATALGIL
ncbi:MAG: enoyl-CoA hydratase/isomerase family protein [Clostridia bacterium]|nr:enoyl-CoA hydratase/isomerase family protein [Clostridia bacterium]